MIVQLKFIQAVGKMKNDTYKPDVQEKRQLPDVQLHKHFLHKPQENGSQEKRTLLYKVEVLALDWSLM